MNEAMSDAMSDSRVTTALPLALPLLPPAAADGGTGPMPPNAEGRRLATPPSLRADRPVDRSVAREAVREAVRDAARHAVDEAMTLGARESAAALTRVGAGDAGVTAAPSPALVAHLGHLRATLTRYVGERRDAGAPVERVLPEVKALVREAAAREAVARELWPDTADALLGQVVRWTITAYYDHPYDHSTQSDGPRAA
jgi:hypothetical protein